MTKRKPAKRNSLGRTPTAQNAIDRLTKMVEEVLNGQMDANACGYNYKPYNIGTDNVFTGSNVGVATFASFGAGDSRFVSFTEAKERGWEGKESLKGKGIPFIRPWVKKYTNDKGEEVERTRWKEYYLYNLADMDHDLGDMPIDSSCLAAEEASSVLEACISKIGAEFIRCAEMAHLKPSFGIISLPAANGFLSWELYCSTLIHEMAHFQGRNSITVKEYEKYRGFEELVAEISAVLVLSQIGIEFPSKNAAYIASWLGHAQTTHKEPIVEALAEASKRIEGILNAFHELKEKAEHAIAA